MDKKGDFADFLILHMQDQNNDKVDENGDTKLKLLILYLVTFNYLWNLIFFRNR